MLSYFREHETLSRDRATRAIKALGTNDNTLDDVAIEMKMIGGCLNYVVVPASSVVYIDNDDHRM